MSDEQFGSLSIDSLSGGKAKLDLDATIQSAAQKLHDYCLDRGFDQTKKVKASITLTVTIMHHESGLFSQRADVNSKLPVAPSTAMQLVVINGKVRAPLAPEINKGDDPAQMTFAHAHARVKKEIG